VQHNIWQLHCTLVVAVNIWYFIQLINRMDFLEFRCVTRTLIAVFTLSRFSLTDSY